MRIGLLVLFTMMMTHAVASSSKDDIQQDRVIEVSGIGNVQSVPDRFSFSMTIEQKGEFAAELNKTINTKTSAVVQALLKIGVDKKAIQSLQVRFNPWIEYDSKTRKQKGFILSRQINVTLKSLALYELAIDKVLNLGVSHINQFTFTNSRNDENYQQALEHALKNARQRAIDMAKVLGLKLAGVVSILEQSSGTVAPVMMRARQDQASSQGYQAGEMSTQARVKVVFALQDGL
ncbi:SIMPL domain-containing protein [uncultured Paraglaciecola sp.]|uniref:SIMPL domain-containing protein n=1 Tax=uncultured Paraglaciecola sp. TaxID=1765024 RepID=UPI00261165C6|nr:SIMPL domain-containing protein [uncultured Paraglaciecola sp.]